MAEVGEQEAPGVPPGQAPALEQVLAGQQAVLAG